MVEVLKTNVLSKVHSVSIIEALNNLNPDLDINFDLTDCDKILRVEGESINLSEIISLLKREGFCCEVLP